MKLYEIRLQMKIQSVYNLGYKAPFCAVLPRHVQPLMGLHSKVRHLALPLNIRLRWKLLIVTCAVAYYGAEIITTVKSFIVNVTWGFYLV